MAEYVQSFAELAEHICDLKAPTVVAVDGRSASGKTTFAARLSRSLDAPVVLSDDVAWNHSFLDWWPHMLEHVINPFRCGSAVDWRPAVWVKHGRAGSIVVPNSAVLIVEGVGTTRREFSDHVDVPIWVETDAGLAEARGLERDGPDGREFWFEWQATERPFFEADKPWDRASLIIDGAPVVQHNPETHFVSQIPHR